MIKNQTVVNNEELVFVYHQKQQEVNNSRRSTVSAIFKNGELSFGVATCGPKDSFCRKIGSAISKGRAVKQPIAQITVGENLDAKIVRDIFFANATKLVKSI